MVDHENPASEAAKLLQSLRREKRGGSSGGRPATIEHVEGGVCRCVACRKARGWSPYNKAGAGGRAVAPVKAQMKKQVDRPDIDPEVDWGA